MAEYEVVGVGGKQAYTVDQAAPPRAYMKVDIRKFGTLLSGEDPVNNVIRTEQQMEYETVAAGQTAQVLGATGAAGDLLSHLIIVVSTAATAAVSILDDATSIAVFPNSPGGGVGTYYVPLNIASINGAWKVTTGAGVTVVAVGRFS